jgi:CYTH domain-containing protein
MIKLSPPSNREIERKYLLRALPDKTSGARVLEVEQGYLPGDRINERIRRTIGADGIRFYRTIKAGSGVDRLEIEEETTQEFFETVWPLTRGKRVAKRRYLIPDRDVVWEIDEFVDRTGLWLAEVELESVEQVVHIPDWLARVLVREVTDEKGFTNQALAR